MEIIALGRRIIIDRTGISWGAHVREHPVGDRLGRTSEAFNVGGWTPQKYGEYYPRQVSIYAALRLLGKSVARAPLRVYQVGIDAEGKPTREWVGPDHPAQTLLTRVNPLWTAGDLWRATEVYLGLWGEAYWAIDRGRDGLPMEIWPLRPDRTKPIPGGRDYIDGYLYTAPGSRESRAFVADEIVWFREFNPLNEWAGLSPVAPIRLSLDMSIDALRGNRNMASNGQTPGLFIKTESIKPSRQEVDRFYENWEKRYKGPDRVGRPALLAKGMEPVNMGFSPKEMELITSLRWGLEEVCRAYDIPKAMLHDVERATYANILTMRRMFWEDSIVPRLMWHEARVNEMLIPMFGDSSLVVAFDTSQIEALQEDEAAKANRRHTYVSDGILTVNEIREDMGRDPVPWGDEPKAAIPALFSASGGHIRAVSEDKAHKAFETVASYSENNFHRLMMELFNEQVDDMLRRLAERRALRPFAALVGAGDLGGNGRADPGGAPTAGLSLFDAEEWNERWAPRGLPVIQAALEAGAREATSTFTLGISFDVNAPITRTWLRDRTAFWAERSNGTTARLVTGLVREANELGESIGQITQRLEDLRLVNNRARALRIARTETVSAVNQGHMEAYEQGGVERKSWLTSGDESRMRESHAAINGQERGLREMFTLGSGVQTSAPGQSGVPGEDINCMCLVQPVIVGPAA